MGEITGFEPQKKKRRRVNIYIDGKYCFSLHEKLAIGLQIGQELSAEEISQLQHDDEVEKQIHWAHRLLSRRPYAIGEVKRKMQQHGVAPSVQEQVVEQLKESALLNDAEFARIWIENRTAFRPRSAMALKMELRKKGVTTADIESALDHFDEEDAAIRAGNIAARRWRDRDEDEFRKKVEGYLRRRGFSYAMTSSVVSDLISEMTNEEEESEGDT